MSARDAVVVGAGPNGLAAAVTLAAAGRSVLLVEAAATVGGGTRSAPLTGPGTVHDVCSAVHPLGVSSPFLRRLRLHEHGLGWVHPDLPLAHPLDGGAAAVLDRSVEATAAGLGADGDRWRHVLGAAAARWDDLALDVTGPLVRPPRHPVALARFGALAVLPAAPLARAVFREEPARALFAGMAAHAFLPLHHPFTASFGLALGASGHSAGWPFARGGSQRIADALLAVFLRLGGEVRTGWRVTDLDELPAARTVLLDLAPRRAADLLGDRMPARARRRFERFRHGPGAFKLDYLLSEPVPWTNEACGRAGTVHVGGTLAEVVEAEAAVTAGRHPARPFVLVAQPSLFDPTRAPAGRHTLWAYCHVPRGSTLDVTRAVEDQIERFAPGFRDVVLERRTMHCGDLEAYNPNYVGGDIAGGSHGGLQLVRRPTLLPYRTGVDGVYLCSASTPPGAGVHGMCGHHAARLALRRELS